MTEIVEFSQWKSIWTIIQAKYASILVFLGACKAYIAGENFDRDSNLKIYLLPGLEAQKVEKHCLRAMVLNQVSLKNL